MLILVSGVKNSLFFFSFTLQFMVSYKGTICPGKKCVLLRGITFSNFVNKVIDDCLCTSVMEQLNQLGFLLGTGL